MNRDDEFTPRPGRVRSRGNASGKHYLSRVHAAVRRTTKSIGGPGGASGFSGTRIGRGAGVGHVSAARRSFAGQRGRRVVVKVNIARATPNGAGALRAHVHYIQRDGVERDGTPGQLYDRAGDEADGRSFVERSGGDRHQLRLIVSPEDAEELGDLKAFTRELMTRAERDLGTRLDWIAADHFDTDNPHTHIVIRGREESGKDLVIAKDYLTHGFRRRGAEIATEELGPRCDNELALMRRREVEKDRFTGVDRELLDEAEDGLVTVGDRRGSFNRFRRALFLQRLKKLEALGLAKDEGASRWRLSGALEPTLRRLGERGDIIRRMTRAAGQDRAESLAIFDPGDAAQKPVIGRIMASGGSDELTNGRYLIVEGADGRTWHANIGAREPGSLPRNGAIVEIVAGRVEPKPSDRSIAEIAARNGGVYSDALHAAHDPSATPAFRLAHKRRLEALRRSGIVERDRAGDWQVPGDYLKHAAAFEARRVAGTRMQVLSWLPLEHLVEREAVTWLDEDAAKQGGARGFGREVETARSRRQAWLVSRGYIDAEGDLSEEQRRTLRVKEIRAEARRLATSSGKTFVSVESGERVEGRFTRAVDLASGRYAVVERAREFTLVPWRETLERRRGQAVAGLMRGTSVDWEFGRKRGRGI